MILSIRSILESISERIKTPAIGGRVASALSGHQTWSDRAERVCGAEAGTHLATMKPGYGGSVTMVHAGTAELAIDRLVILVLQAGPPLSCAEERTYIRESTRVILHSGPFEGRRCMAESLVSN